MKNRQLLLKATGDLAIESPTASFDVLDIHDWRLPWGTTTTSHHDLISFLRSNDKTSSRSTLTNNHPNTNDSPPQKSG